MRLVAVWIEKYMSIVNQSFNFGDEIHFSFEFNEQTRALLVSEKKTYNYFDLFSNGKIINISGIIGDNGSGKTSILKFLNVCSSEKPITHSAILLFRDNDTFKICEYKSEFKNARVNIIKDESLKNLNIEINSSSKPFLNLDLLYYSNIYSENNDNYLKLNNNLNRSVDYLTRKCLSRIKIDAYNKKIDKSGKNYNNGELNYNVLKLYFNERFKNLLNFLTVINTEHQELKNIINIIPFPSKLNVNFREDIFEEVIDFAGRSNYDFKKLGELINYAKNLFLNENNPAIRFRNELIFNLFIFAFRYDLFKKSQPSTSLVELEKFVNNILLNSDLFDELLNYMKSKKNRSQFYQITNINNIIRKIDSNKYNIEISNIIILNSYNYQLNVDDNIWSFIKDINSVFEIEADQLIEFRWNPLSAGEEALLNQFVQIWQGISCVKKSNLLINIDEGELYLHPDWQRKYVNLLYLFIKYWVDRDDNIKNVQIILTSHSPFIVSDIPRFNLVFLKKEMNILTGIKELKTSEYYNHFNTFGSNIHELFTNSFFLDDGLIGEFARIRIADLIKEINTKEIITKEEFDFNYKNRISLIGENFIKAKLFELVAKKSENSVIERIIETHTQEIEWLNILKNRNKHDTN